MLLEVKGILDQTQVLTDGYLKILLLNTMYKTNFAQNITLRSTVEPIKQFRIELTANKTSSNNYSEYFRWDNDMNFFNSYTPTETGSFSISFISWKTAFKSDNKDGESEIFNNFREYRDDIARELASNNPNFNGQLVDPNTGFPTEYVTSTNDTIKTLVGGYGATSTGCFNTCLIAAYSGGDPSNSKLTAFPAFPLPNWRITYDGLLRIPYIKKKIQAV